MFFLLNRTKFFLSINGKTTQQKNRDMVAWYPRMFDANNNISEKKLGLTPCSMALKLLQHH